MMTLTNKENTMSTDIDYEPMSEEEALGLLPKGDYEATITAAENKHSKEGKKYVVFTLEARGVELTTWCTFPFMLKHAAESIGLGGNYENKTLRLSDFPGKKLVIRVNVKEGNEQYPRPKNVVFDFKALKQENLPFDDAVPF
jgi:hypothetical protein